MTTDFKQSNWWKYLQEPMRDLVAQSYELLEQEGRRVGKYEYHDYSFIVFPMAKAYEGFLKKIFLDLKFISVNQYAGEHFRIGRALNPNLPKRYRSAWVYGKLLTFCGNEELPLHMWQVWKRGRNRIFHFFPDHHEFISYEEAEGLILEISQIMEEVLSGCGLEKNLT